MRWSLILSTLLAAQSALSFVAATPSSDELQRRGLTGARESSKRYRKNAQHHPNEYTFEPFGPPGVNRKSVPKGKITHPIPGHDADHIFEHQMLDHHLEKHKLQFENLQPGLQRKVKGIMNGPGNVVQVPAGINRGKGRVIAHGMEGKAIKPKKNRDDYIKLSYPTAKKTAKSLDKAFKDYHHDFGTDTVRNTLRTTMNKAKIMKPGDRTPASSKAGSDTGSIKGTPKRPPPVVKKPAVPTRKSARIAAKNAGKTTATQKRPLPAGKKPAAKEPTAATRKSARIAAKAATPKRPAFQVGKKQVQMTSTGKSARVAAKNAGKAAATPKSPLPAGKKPAVKEPAAAARKSARIATKNAATPKPHVFPVGKKPAVKVQMAPTRKSARIAVANKAKA